MRRHAAALMVAIAAAGWLTAARAEPVLAECPFLPPWPDITSALPSARQVIVGEIVTEFSQADLHLAADQAPRDYALRITHVLRGDARVGSVLDVQYLLPNWPWMMPFEGDLPFPSCTSLRTSPGEVIALALDALFPGGEIVHPFGNWMQPPTRYNAVAVVEAGPYADMWPEREIVTLSQLEALAAMPATDTPSPATPSCAAGFASVVIVAVGIVGFALAWRWPPRRRQRRALAALVIALGACGPAPSPSEQQPTSVPSATLVATPVTTTTPTVEPTTSPFMFSFDVENRASVGVIVSVASDTAATLPGFEPGQRGTISIRAARQRDVSHARAVHPARGGRTPGRDDPALHQCRSIEDADSAPVELARGLWRVAPDRRRRARFLRAVACSRSR